MGKGSLPEGIAKRQEYRKILILEKYERRKGPTRETEHLSEGKSKKKRLKKMEREILIVERHLQISEALD